MKLISWKVESESYIMPCKWFKTPPLVTKKSKENFTLGFFLLYVVFEGCSNFFVFYIIIVVLYSCHPFRCSLSSFGYIFYLSYLMMVDPFYLFYLFLSDDAVQPPWHGWGPVSLFLITFIVFLPPPHRPHIGRGPFNKWRIISPPSHLGFPVKHLFPRKIFSSKKTLFKLITTFMFRFLPD